MPRKQGTTPWTQAMMDDEDDGDDVDDEDDDEDSDNG